jgi:hypothetical protein
MIKGFEKVATVYLQNKMTQMSAKDHFFKACLLYMVNDDMPGAKKCFDTASFEDPSFDNSRQ